MGIGLAAALTAGGCTLPPEPLANRGCSAFHEACEPPRQRPLTVADGAPRHRLADQSASSLRPYPYKNLIRIPARIHALGLASHKHIPSTLVRRMRGASDITKHTPKRRQSPPPGL